MEMNCEGCAGCCIDWRDLSPNHSSSTEKRDKEELRGRRDEREDVSQRETGGNEEVTRGKGRNRSKSRGRRGEHEGRFTPLDDIYNFIVLTREDVRDFLNAGLSDCLLPRVWKVEDEKVEDSRRVEIDGYELAALDGKPVFYMGLKRVEKPVSPFGISESRTLPACVFLDPESLQYRIHGEEVYPRGCSDYPGHNLRLDKKTECERVEDAFGEERLIDATPPDELKSFFPGRMAVGEKLFVHSEPNRLKGMIRRIVEREIRHEDIAEFAGVAGASQPGSREINPEKYEESKQKALENESWITESIERLSESDVPEKPSLVREVEEERGAPETPGWQP